MLARIANVEQAKSWDGDDGDHWTRYADHYEAALQAHYVHMRRAVAVAPADRVLDIGCGTGETTIDAARAAHEGSALGVDLSSRMLAFARERAARAGVTNVRFEQADAQTHRFEQGAFDVAMSRTGGMFFGDPVAAYRNIASAMRPGGRLVLLTWRGIEANEWLQEVLNALDAGRGMPPPLLDQAGPLSMADSDRVRSLLTAAGFGDIALQALDEPFRVGADAEDAFDFMSGAGIVHGMLAGAEDAVRGRAMDGLRATFAAHDTGAGVLYRSGSWLITARKP